MHNFDAQTEIQKIRLRKQLKRKKHYRKSRLQPYRSELVQMRQAGVSYPDLALWLRAEKRIKVHHTTVMRYLKKLPELNQEQN
jgi:hypothetical protein